MVGWKVGVRRHIVEEVDERGRGGVGKHKYYRSKACMRNHQLD